MTRVKRLWMPLLLGVLLTATLAGVAGARPNARAEASPALVDYMLCAHHCIPDWNGGVVRHSYHSEHLGCVSGDCTFECPIKPPHEGLIRAQRLAMYAYDNDAGGVFIWLHHVYPKTGTVVDRLPMEHTSDSAADPQVYAYNPANFKVSQLQDLYVEVIISGTSQKLYGFKLKYEPL